MSFNVNIFSPFVYIVEENGQSVAKNFAFFSLVLIYNILKNVKILYSPVV